MPLSEVSWKWPSWLLVLLKNLLSGEVQAIPPVFCLHCSESHRKSASCAFGVGIPGTFLFCQFLKERKTFIFLPQNKLGRLTTKSRSISTVEGSGATCTRNCFELFFFKTGDFSMVQLTQKMQKISKKWKKTPKMHWHHTTQMVMETLVTSG